MGRSGSLGVLAALCASLLACGDDASRAPTGGGGSGGGAATGPGASTTSGGSTTATTASTASSGGAADGGGGSAEGGGGQGGAGQGGAPSTGGSGPGGVGGGGGEGGTCEPAGAGACVAIDPAELVLVSLTPTERVMYRAPVDVDVGCGGPVELVLELYGSGFDATYDGEAAGTFDLGTGGDADYATCSRCFTAGNAAVGLFQAAGTLTVDPASTHLADGGLVASVTGLVLVESLFDPGSGASTPVEGGLCFTLDQASFAVPAPEVPPGWFCPDASYDALDGCDCACGAYDPDCDDPSQAIYFCGEPHFPGDGPSCLPDGTCSNEGGQWTCDELWYGDGECDCGCGIQDFDCSTTDDDTECQFCLACDPNALEFACYDVVDPDDTTVCLD